MNHACDRSGCVVVWLVGAAVLVIAAIVVLALIVAAPRAAAIPTTEATRDMSGLRDGTSGWPLPGAPRSQAESRRPGEAGRELTLAAGAPRFAGTATWYCSDGRDGSRRSACTAGYGPSDLVAAIDTDLGIGKGERIRVTFGKHSVEVTVVDVCACAGERLVDLTIGAFQELASWGHGVLPVTVQVIGGPRVTLPPTDGGAE